MRTGDARRMSYWDRTASQLRFVSTRALFLAGPTVPSHLATDLPFQELDALAAHHIAGPNCGRMLSGSKTGLPKCIGNRWPRLSRQLGRQQNVRLGCEGASADPGTICTILLV